MLSPHQARQLRHPIEAERRSCEELLRALKPKLQEVIGKGHALGLVKELRKVVGREPSDARNLLECQRFGVVLAQKFDRATKTTIVTRRGGSNDRVGNVSDRASVRGEELLDGIGGRDGSLYTFFDRFDALVVERATAREHLGRAFECRFEVCAAGVELVADMRRDRGNVAVEMSGQGRGR